MITCSGTVNGYSVEFRNNYPEPMRVGDHVFSERWRAVSFPKGHPGVPIGPVYHAPEFARSGLMSYQAAQALRWWVHAEVEAAEGIGGICLESRIVKHKIAYSYSSERVSEHGSIGGEDRSNCIPDWGKKETEKPVIEETTTAAA